MRAHVKSTDLRRKFGAAIRQVRKDAGVTQGELAALINLHPVNMSRLESGLFPVDVDHIGLIAAALNVSPTVIVMRAV